jgi:hypothetical protein
MVGMQNGYPKDLQQLEFRFCNQRGPAPQLAEAFPHLRLLKLVRCDWDALPGNMERLTSLKELEIILCANILSLPTLPQSLEMFRLDEWSYEFAQSCRTVGHPNWEKIKHIPIKILNGRTSKTAVLYAALFFDFYLQNIGTDKLFPTLLMLVHPFASFGRRLWRERITRRRL